MQKLEQEGGGEKQQKETKEEQPKEPVMLFDSHASASAPPMRLDCQSANTLLRSALGYNEPYMPMPVSLDNGLLELMKKFDDKLWVGGKNDGERFFFSIQRAQTCLYARSTFEPTLCKPAQILRNYAEIHGDCLLDGEWHEERKLFCAHDLVELNGRSMIDEPFGKRRAELTELVERLQQRLRVVGVSAEFQLGCKLFVPLDTFEQELLPLLSKDKPKEESKQNQQQKLKKNGDDDDDGSLSQWQRWMPVNTQDSKIWVPVDGLIIANDKSKYVRERDDSTSLIKIKFVSTLDFQITSGGYVRDVKHGAFRLAARSDRQGEMIRCYVLRREDIPKQKMLDQIVDCLDNNEKPIAECWYNRKISRWVLLKLRGDKSEPNHITTVLHEVLMVADNIGLDDIVSASRAHAEAIKKRHKGTAMDV